MRDAIPLVCTRVRCWWHATRVRSSESGPWRKSNVAARRRVFVCHAPAATDNHGYFTNTEYFRISLIPSFPTAGAAGEIRRHRRNVGPESWSSDADRLPSSLALFLGRFSGWLRGSRAQRGTYDPKRRNKLLAKPIRLNETERLD